MFWCTALSTSVGYTVVLYYVPRRNKFEIWNGVEYKEYPTNIECTLLLYEILHRNKFKIRNVI